MKGEALLHRLLIVVGVCFNLVGAAMGWGFSDWRIEERFDGHCIRSILRCPEAVSLVCCLGLTDVTVRSNEKAKMCII